MSIASTFGTPTAYYGPHNTVVCPDCHQRADVDFGDHGGDCLDSVVVAIPGTALGIVRKYAERHPRFSANDIRPALRCTKPSSRGPAMGAAVRKGWIEEDGWVKSTDEATKRHKVAVYKSLIFRPAAGRTVA
jgi:hypothetical protein